MKQLQVLQSQLLVLKDLKPNTGQIPGLPANPRSIDATRLAKLKQSLQQNPEMLSLREILVFQYEGQYIVIGGNQRLTALAGTNIKKVPCKIIPPETTAEQLRAYLIKDNIEFGTWVDEMLGKDWDMSELDDFGMEDVEKLNSFKDNNESEVKPQPKHTAHTEAHQPAKPVAQHSKSNSEQLKQSSVSLEERQRMESDIDGYLQKLKESSAGTEYVTITLVVPGDMKDQLASMRQELKEMLSEFDGIIIK